jgi:hypothetical protein
MEALDDDADVLYVLILDEEQFNLSGYINKQNFHY